MSTFTWEGPERDGISGRYRNAIVDGVRMFVAVERTGQPRRIPYSKRGEVRFGWSWLATVRQDDKVLLQEYVAKNQSMAGLVRRALEAADKGKD